MADFAVLFKQFDDPDPNVRQQALEALLDAGATAPDALLTALDDILPKSITSFRIREPVTSLLAEIGWPAIPSLIRTAKHNPSEWIREVAWKALMQFRKRLSYDAVKSLLRSQPSAEFAFSPKGVFGGRFRFDPGSRMGLQDRLEQDLERTRRAMTPEERLQVLALPEAIAVMLGNEAGLPARLDSEGDWVWDYEWVKLDLAQLGTDIVDVLVARYHRTSGEMQKMLAASLGMICDPRAIVKLLSVLYDSSPDLRAAAAEALGKIRDQHASNGLAERAFDPDERVRRAALNALAKIGGSQAIDVAIQVIHNDPEHYIRWDAATTLAHLAVDHGKARDALIKELQDTDRKVRWYVANVLESHVVPDTTDALIKALADSDDSVRYLVAGALSAIGDQSAMEALIGALWDPIVKSAVATALTDPHNKRASQNKEVALKALLTAASDEDSPVRTQAIESLGLIGGDNTVAALIAFLNSEDTDIRGAAVSGLMRSSASVTRSLLQALALRSNTDFRIAAHTVFIERYKLLVKDAMYSDDATAPYNKEICQFLADSDVTLRREAAEVLGIIGNPQVLKPLISALKDPDHRVRQAAIIALLSLKTHYDEHIKLIINEVVLAVQGLDTSLIPDVEKALIRMGPQALTVAVRLLTSLNSVLRASASSVLGQAGAAGIEPLAHTLRDPIVTVRERAVQSLGQIGGDEIVDALTKALDDPSRTVRKTVVTVLAGQQGLWAASVLNKALQDEDSEIKKLAGEALSCVQHT